MVNVRFFEDGKEVACFPTTHENLYSLIKESTAFSLKAIKSWEEQPSVIANLLFLGLSGEEEVEARNLEYRVDDEEQGDVVEIDIAEGLPIIRRHEYRLPEIMTHIDPQGQEQEDVELDIVEGDSAASRQYEYAAPSSFGTSTPVTQWQPQAPPSAEEIARFFQDGRGSRREGHVSRPRFSQSVTLRVSADALRRTEDEHSQPVFFGSHNGATPHFEVPSAVSGGGIGGQRIMDELRRLGRSRPAGVPLSDPPRPIGGGYNLSQREADALRDMWQIVSAQRNRRN